MGYMASNAITRGDYDIQQSAEFYLPGHETEYMRFRDALNGRALVVTREWTEGDDDEETIVEVLVAATPMFAADLLTYHGITTPTDDGGYRLDGIDEHYVGRNGVPVSISARYSVELIGFPGYALRAIENAINPKTELETQS